MLCWNAWQRETPACRVARRPFVFRPRWRKFTSLPLGSRVTCGCSLAQRQRRQSAEGKVRTPRRPKRLGGRGGGGREVRRGGGGCGPRGGGGGGGVGGRRSRAAVAPGRALQLAVDGRVA